MCNYEGDNRHISCILSHLADKHNIKRGSRKDGVSSEFSTYLDVYFNNPKCICGCGKSVYLHTRKMQFNLFAPGCINASRYRSPACPEFYLFAGLTVDETISKISTIQTKSILPERKLALSVLNTGIANPSSIGSIINRTGRDINTICNELQANSIGSKNGFYGKKHTNETLRRLAIARAKQSKQVTKPELIMYGMLVAWGFNFSYESVVDRWPVDFLLSDGTIVEVFGDYWHSDKFKNGSKKERDDLKIAELKAAGHKVIIVWESQLINKQLDRIRTLFNENQINI